MKLKKALCYVLAFSLVASVPSLTKVAKADNPIVQTYYTADPSPLATADRLYVITSHDEDVIEGDFYTMKNWNCYSTADMVNWQDHGTIFGQSSFSWGHLTDFRAWAAQAVERNGKYYLYAPLLRKGHNDEAGSPGYGIGVAVADNPYGPYEDPLGKPLSEGDWFDIDPTVMVDDDGQAYLYYGQTLKYVKLNEDMISYDKSVGNNGIIPAEVPGYVEGPWISKHNNMYYFLYAGSSDDASSSHQGGEALRYTYSDSPEGPWTDGGLLMETTRGHCFTNHPGLVDFKGRSYLFYHTDELKGGGSYHRSVCVEEFAYNEDGTIELVDMTEGVDPIGTLNPYAKVEAETIAYADGTESGKLNVKTQTCGTNDIKVTNLNEGDYIKVREVEFGNAGAIKFSANVSSTAAGGSFDVRLDAIDGDIIGTVEIPETGEDVYKTVTIDVKETKGKHDIYFTFNSNGMDDNIKFDFWQFEEKYVPTPTPVPTVAPTQVPAVQPTTTPVPEVKAPAKVKNLKASAAKKKVTLKWKKLSKVAGYEVKIALNKKFKKGLKTAVTKKNKITIKKLKSKKTYYLKVCAFNKKADGTKVKGKYSSVVKVRVK